MSVYIPVEIQRLVRARFAGCCAYCHTAEELSAAIFEFEHIVPRKAAGETAFENLCLACPTCNRFKADRTVAIDPVSQQTVPLFHPQRDRWAGHFAWDEDGTRLIGLSPTGRATISALKMNRPQLIRARRMWVALGEHRPPFDRTRR